VDPQWLPDGGWTEADQAAGGCTAPGGSRTACATEISQLKPLTCLSVNRAKFAVELVSSASIPQPILFSEIKKMVLFSMPCNELRKKLQFRVFVIIYPVFETVYGPGLS
jgi:hypothetical protein